MGGSGDGNRARAGNHYRELAEAAARSCRRRPCAARGRPRRRMRMAHLTTPLGRSEVGYPSQITVRANGAPGGYSFAASVDPDASQPHALRLSDVELEMVAHHPGICRRHIELLERARVDPGLGLAESQLAFDRYRIEKLEQSEPGHLVLLHRRGAVGHERKAAALVTKPSNRVQRVWERLQRGDPLMAVRTRDPVGQSGIGADVDERLLDDRAGGGIQVETSDTVTLWIRPEPGPRPLNRLIQRFRTDAGIAMATVACVPPARLDGAAVVQDGVVQVE